MIRLVADNIEQPWRLIWLGLFAHAALLILTAGLFDHELYLHEVPAISLSIGLMTAGLIALRLPHCIMRSANADQETAMRILFGVVAGGLVLRLMMFWTVPALETDLYRYLWDGAVVAIGFNPYAFAPSEIAGTGTPQALKDLATEAGYIFERINHRDVRTIYPPVAQLFFASAYLAETWSITAWRVVCLLCECTTLWLLIRLLDELGRSRLWAALYWWNPLIVKELMNSAHMEAVLIPVLLGAVLLAVRRKNVLACLALALAAGIKIWPVLLLPLVLRPLLFEPRRLATAVGLTFVCLLALALPPILAGLDQTSGFVAYASEWRRNGALNPLLEVMFQYLLSAYGSADGGLANVLARGVAAAAVGGVAMLVVVPPVRDARDMVNRMAWVVLALFLMSPAQYPWYLAWIMPFMVLRNPMMWVQLAAVILPVYYASFYFRGHNIEWVFNDIVVYLMWVPIWLVLIIELKEPLSRGWARLSSFRHS